MLRGLLTVRCTKDIPSLICSEVPGMTQSPYAFVRISQLISFHLRSGRVACTLCMVLCFLLVPSARAVCSGEVNGTVCHGDVQVSAAALAESRAPFAYTQVTGVVSIYISAADQGANLAPFEDLRWIGGHLHIQAYGRVDLSGLGGLEIVEGTLSLEGPGIERLSGLDRLEQVSRLSIHRTRLLNLDGLGSPLSVKEVFISQNDELEGLAGLRIYGVAPVSVNITRNPRLVDCAALTPMLTTPQAVVAGNSAGCKGRSMTDARRPTVVRVRPFPQMTMVRVPVVVEASMSAAVKTVDEDYTCMVNYGEGPDSIVSGLLDGSTCRAEYAYRSAGTYAIEVILRVHNERIHTATFESVLVGPRGTLKKKRIM